jgi:hypothetical protein
MAASQRRVGIVTIKYTLAMAKITSSTLLDKEQALYPHFPIIVARVLKFSLSACIN